MTNNAAHSLFITELGRGMAVTLGHISKSPQPSTIPLRKGPCLQGSVGSTPLGGTPVGRRGASPASSVRPSALLRQSQARPRREVIALEEQRDTTLT